MKIAGIICEYNPFHNGHEYLVRKAKNDGCAVVGVMSGSYTQRGELAISDKYVRAEVAVKCGVDLVLELPFPFCMSSAEFFAKGGVAVLEQIGAKRIYFGSECGDIGLIKEAANAAASEMFFKIREQITHSEGSAKSYFESLGRVLGKDVELLSNDILGIEYAKEVKRRKLDVELCTVKRVGDRYLDEEITSDYASATAIRNFLFSNNTEPLENYMPISSLNILKNAVVNRIAPVDINKIETAILSFWRMVNPENLSDIAELGNGLEFRIKEAALSTDNLEDMELYASTKKYTKSKIRRAILFGMLGVTKADLDAEPEYTSVLAANKVGREVLASLRKDEKFKIVTKTADAPNCRQSELSSRADALYTLAMPKAQSAGYLAKKKIYIE